MHALARQLALLSLLALPGCFVQRLGPAVTYADTSTPGLKFVVVHPSGDGSSITYPDGATVPKSSDYVLLCDGRAGDGMTCDIPPEVGATVLSKNPSAREPGAAIDLGVGTIDTVVSSPSKSSNTPAPTPSATSSDPKGHVP